jgi:excisionase family DNA binding protein
MPIQKKDGIAFTVDEAAEYLGYSVHTIRQYINRELISATKFGPAVVIDKAECDRFKKAKRSPGRPPQK